MSSRIKDAENKMINERFERWGTLRDDGVEKKITNLIVKGQIEI